MHSSRMRIAHSLPYEGQGWYLSGVGSQPRRGSLSRVVSVQWVSVQGVSVQWKSLSWVGLCPGGYLSEGILLGDPGGGGLCQGAPFPLCTDRHL